MSQFKPLVTTLVYLPDMKTVFEVHKGNLGKKVMYSYTFGTKKILKEYFKEGYKHVRIEEGIQLKKFYNAPWKSKVKGDPTPTEVNALKSFMFYIVDKKNPNYTMWREAYIKSPSIDDYNLDDETKDTWRDIVPAL
jgi:hypothetical protein